MQNNIRYPTKPKEKERRPFDHLCYVSSSKRTLYTSSDALRDIRSSILACEFVSQSLLSQIPNSFSPSTDGFTEAAGAQRVLAFLSSPLHL
ncbi:hypothetical protein NC651_024441 [Populus alba x Populus x berolinensis]|nr:hypothetical protein NC651_024438 [Populus alba x Populus x berolinensis]KAJ6890929.1 hypothetical protein NC651_024441 [Populus alba x Populus x berolinensis]